MSGFTQADVPDQSNKTFVVTGANTGMGFEVANALATPRNRSLAQTISPFIGRT
ncbi:hypothetical protein [Rhizobium hainanense]|uniref:Short chain dehydrogenase n=1 Tax=Rhizobium hainanense TaxID=52131 RepID=A0A1C3VCM8_9HYPH|nr:hypothetical protein [Rhizobium hainanense]SCB25274.1 hypothetical protein GA0061100_105271 [Rhizobium hainanense]